MRKLEPFAVRSAKDKVHRLCGICKHELCQLASAPKERKKISAPTFAEPKQRSIRTGPANSIPGHFDTFLLSMVGSKTLNRRTTNEQITIYVLVYICTGEHSVDVMLDY